MEYIVKMNSVEDQSYEISTNWSNTKLYQINTNWFDKDGCLHKNCSSCNGTGVRIDGLGPCVHMISCPCPLCSPRC